MPVCQGTGRKEYFEQWRRRSLDQEQIVYLYLDGFTAKVRLGRRCGRVSILAAVGVKDSGEKVLLGLWLKGLESTRAWRLVLEELIGRGLTKPVLVIIDGNPLPVPRQTGGLRAAVEEAWPGIKLQRCFVHKLRNLMTHAPKYLHDEIKADFHRIIYADSLDQAKEEWSRFVPRWRKRCSGVVKSF